MSIGNASAQNYLLVKKHACLTLYNSETQRNTILLEDYRYPFYIGDYAEFYDSKIYFYVDFLYKKMERHIYSYDIQNETLHSEVVLQIKDYDKDYYKINIDTFSYLAEKRFLLYYSITGADTNFIKEDYRYSTIRKQIYYFKSDSYGDLIKVDSISEKVFIKNQYKTFWDFQFNGFRSPDISLDGVTILSAYIHKNKECRKKQIEKVSIIEINTKTKEIETLFNSEFWFKPYWFGTKKYILLRHLPKYETSVILKESNESLAVHLRYNNFYILDTDTKMLNHILFVDYCIPVKNCTTPNSLFSQLINKKN